MRPRRPAPVSRPDGGCARSGNVVGADRLPRPLPSTVVKHARARRAPRRRARPARPTCPASSIGAIVGTLESGNSDSPLSSTAPGPLDGGAGAWAKAPPGSRVTSVWSPARHRCRSEPPARRGDLGGLPGERDRGPLGVVERHDLPAAGRRRCSAAGPRSWRRSATPTCGRHRAHAALAQTSPAASPGEAPITSSCDAGIPSTGWAARPPPAPTACGALRRSAAARLGVARSTTRRRAAHEQQREHRDPERPGPMQCLAVGPVGGDDRHGAQSD